MKINLESMTDVLYTLEWESTRAAHAESYFGQSVNMWRDCFPEKVFESMAGLRAGDQVTLDFDPGDVLPAYSEDRILTLKKRQFGNFNRPSDAVVPVAGRFYPKGMLRDLAGIFPNNVEPFRCLNVDDGHISVDFNHPLAGKPLSLAVRIDAVSEKKKERGGSSTDWMEAVTTGPGMQVPVNGRATDFLSPDALSRQDNSPDELFYKGPRLVNHIDDRARDVVKQFYRERLQPGMRVLDLMAGWESHIPDGMNLGSITGLGMNREEMVANSALSDHVVHDLNRQTKLPFGSDTYHAVICTVSIEYLTNPQTVFKDVARVLKPGGVFMVTFSNRWFPPKVTRLWTELHEFERLGFVTGLFLNTPNFEKIETYSMRGLPRPESDKYYSDLWISDPIYAVAGRKAVRGE